MIVGDQGEVIAFLSRPEAYGGGVSAVERIETHISEVFLAGERAYKLKRAVRFSYLDFSTTERRKRFCEAEVAVNRRTAADLYLGVVPVTRTRAGGLSLGGDGDPVDWLVVMARFDGEDLADRLAERGRLDVVGVERIADAIAAFHRQAEPKPGSGGSAALAAIIEDNARAFAECAPGRLDQQRVLRLLLGQRAALAACAEMLDERSRHGLVRHCHGDLHLRNIVLADGRPLLFDAIEFDPALAEIDVLYDLAFLVMDLRFRNLPVLASVALNRYLDWTGDAGGLPSLPLFLSLRAAIRSHVDAAAAAGQADPDKLKALLGDAGRYLALALAYLETVAPRLVAVGGLSGSGKSRVARFLAPLLGTAAGARVVRTDTTRKRLLGVAFSDRLPSEAYTPETAARTYEAVLAEARLALRAGHSVIIDAVSARPSERQAIAALAEALHVPFQGLWLETSVADMQRRVTRRRQDASDATAEVVRRQIDYDLGDLDWVRIDSSGPPQATLDDACDVLGLKRQRLN